MGFEGRTASSTVPDEAVPRLRASGGRVKPGSKPKAETAEQLPTRTPAEAQDMEPDNGERSPGWPGTIASGPAGRRAGVPAPPPPPPWPRPAPLRALRAVGGARARRPRAPSRWPVVKVSPGLTPQDLADTIRVSRPPTS